MGSKERDIILEALKCLRYDTERVEKLVLNKVGKKNGK